MILSFNPTELVDEVVEESSLKMKAYRAVLDLALGNTKTKYVFGVQTASNEILIESAEIEGYAEELSAVFDEMYAQAPPGDKSIEHVLPLAEPDLWATALEIISKVKTGEKESIDKPYVEVEDF